ncbi:hypothetical protein [Legionella sp. 16cNR16C]|uniref:hypothetical protein n=1 Tax=Legionella sp. 16cNR16C TaxID=2905656 RepID=UPI001E428570|nr:hypothetical protein [Legionella sp. 16cNR16C]MCE3045186.1 hypothetical protein [Legionella sp. 16cNR16C]
MLDKLKAILDIFSNPVLEFTDKQLKTLESFKEKQVAAFLRAQRELICKTLAEGYDFPAGDNPKVSIRFNESLNSHYLSNMYTVGVPFPKSYLPILLEQDADINQMLIEPGKIYFSVQDGKIEYTVIAPPAQKVSARLDPLNLGITLSDPLTIENLQANLPLIMHATHKAGHTVLNYSSEPREVVQIKDLINALYHGEQAFLDLESLNIRGVYHLDIVDVNKKPVTGKIYLRNPLDSFSIAAFPQEGDLSANTLYLKEEGEENKTLRYSFIHPITKQLFEGSFSADELKTMLGEEETPQFLSTLRAGDFSKLELFKKKLGSNLLKAGELPLIYYVINTRNQRLIVDKIPLEELSKIFSDEEINRLCFALEEHEIENLQLLKDGIVSIAKERQQIVEAQEQRQLDIQKLLNSTIDHAYTACYLATHLDSDLVEMFSREFAVGEQLLSGIQNYADSPERGVKLLEQASQFARNHAYTAGYVAGVAVDQLQPKGGKTDYNFLTHLSAKLPEYLQEFTKQIKSHSQELMQALIEKGVPLDPKAIETLQEMQSLDKKAIESLQASALAMLNSITLLQDNRLFLPLQVIHYIKILRNVVTLTSSILAQSMNMNEATQRAVCAQLSKLKYDLLPQLFALADKIEDQFLLQPGSLSDPINTQIKALYSAIIEHTGKLVKFSEQAPELSTVEDSKLLELRIQGTRARIDHSRQKLYAAQDAKEAFLKFYGIIQSPQYRGMRIMDLPLPVRELLTSYFMRFRHSVEQYDVNLANAIVYGLNGGDTSTFQTIKEYYDGWWKKYEGVDWIANLLNHAGNIGSLIERELNTQNFHLHSNIALIESIYTKADLRLYPFDPSRQVLTFDEQKALDISKEAAPAYGINTDDKWGTVISKPENLNAKQCLSLMTYYAGIEDRLLSANAAYKNFMLSLARYSTLPGNTEEEKSALVEAKTELRNWYNIFQPYFCVAFSDPRIQFIDKENIDWLNSDELTIPDSGFEFLQQHESDMHICFADAAAVCRKRAQAYAGLTHAKRNKEVVDEAQYSLVKTIQANSLTEALKLYFDNQRHGYTHNLTMPEPVKAILERLKLKTLSALPLGPLVKGRFEQQITHLFNLDEQLKSYPLSAEQKAACNQLLAKICNQYIQLLEASLAPDYHKNYLSVKEKLQQLQEELIPQLLSLTDELEIHAKAELQTFTKPLLDNLNAFHNEIMPVVSGRYPALDNNPPLHVVSASAVKARIAPVYQRIEACHYNSNMIGQAQDALEEFYLILEDEEFKDKRIIDLSAETKELLKKQFAYFRPYLLAINPSLEASIVNGLNSQGRSVFYGVMKHWDYHVYGNQTNDWVVHVLANKENLAKALQDASNRQTEHYNAGLNLIDSIEKQTITLLNPAAKVNNDLILFNELEVLGIPEEKYQAYKPKKEAYCRQITTPRRLKATQAQQLYAYYLSEHTRVERAATAFENFIQLLEASPAASLLELSEADKQLARQYYNQFQPYFMVFMAEALPRQLFERLDQDIVDNLNAGLFNYKPAPNSISKDFFKDSSAAFQQTLRKTETLCLQQQLTYRNLGFDKLADALAANLDLGAGLSAPELTLKPLDQPLSNALAAIPAEPLNYGHAGNQAIYYEVTDKGLAYSVVTAAGESISDILSENDLPDLSSPVSEHIPFLDFENIKTLAVSPSTLSQLEQAFSILQKAKQEWDSYAAPRELKDAASKLAYKLTRQSFYTLRELLQNGASNPQFIRHKLLVMKEEIIPQLLGIADQIELKAQLVHGKLGNRLEESLESLYLGLVKETEKFFPVVADSPELLEGSAAAFDKRSQGPRERQQIAQQNLNKIERAQAAFEAFYQIIEDEELQGKRLIDLPPSTKLLLKKHFVYFRSYVLEAAPELEDAIVNGLNGEGRAALYGFKALYDRYVHNYQNMDWIANVRSNKELIGKGIARDNASQQHMMDQNRALEEELVAKAEIFLHPVSIEQDLVLFNEAKAIHLSPQASREADVQAMDYGRQICKMDNLSFEQAESLHAYYTLRKDDLQKAELYFEQFTNILQGAKTEFVCDMSAEEKLNARRYYYQFRPYFLAATAAKRSVENMKELDAAIIQNLNPESEQELRIIKVRTNDFSNNAAWFKEVLASMDKICDRKLMQYQQLGDGKLKERLDAKISYPAGAPIAELKLRTDIQTEVRSDFAEALASPFLHDELRTLSSKIMAVIASRGHAPAKVLPNLVYGNRSSYVFKHDYYAQKIGDFRESLMKLTQFLNISVKTELHLGTQERNKLPFPELEDPHKVLAQSHQVLHIKQLFNALYHVEQIIKQLQKLDNSSTKLLYVFYLLQAYGHVSELLELCKALAADPHLSMLANELLAKAQDMKRVVMEQSEPYLSDASNVDPEEVPGEVRYNAIWYTLQAFFMVPAQIKSALEGQPNLSEAQLLSIQTNTKKVVIHIERIIANSDSYFRLLLETPVMYRLFQELRVRLAEFTQTTNNFTIDHLEEINTVIFAKILLETDKWEDKLNLAPGTLTGPMKVILDELYKGMLEPLDLVSEKHMRLVHNFSPIVQRKDAAYLRLDEAENQIEPIKSKMKPLTTLMGAMDHYLNLVNQLNFIQSQNKDAKDETEENPALDKINKGIEKAKTSVLQSYAEAYPLLEEHHKQLPLPKEISAENKLIDQLIHNSELKTAVKLANIRDRVRSTYSYYLGNLSTAELAIKSAEEKIAYLEQLQTSQVQENSNFRRQYTENTFDKRVELIINRQVGLHMVDQEYKAKLKEHLMSFKNDFVERALNEQDIKRKIRKELMNKARQFQNEHFAEYQQLDQVKAAINAFKLYFAHASSALQNQKSLYESQKTLTAKQIEIKKLETIADDTSIPISERLENLKSEVESPVFKTIITARQHLDMFSLAWVKRCFFDLLEALHLYKPAHLRKYDQLHSAAHTPFSKMDNPNGYGQNPHGLFNKKQQQAPVVDDPVNAPPLINPLT